MASLKSDGSSVGRWVSSIASFWYHICMNLTTNKRVVVVVRDLEIVESKILCFYDSWTTILLYI